MKKILKKTFFLLMFSFMLSNAYSHDMWIHSPDFTPKYSKKFGSVATIYGGWGHMFPVDDVFKVKSTFKVLSPNNKVKELETNNLLSEKIRMKDEGNYIVSGKLKPYYWTSYYDKKGNRAGKREAKGDLQNIIESKQFNRFSKAIFTVGNANDENYKKVLGDDLEIVPLSNPNKLYGKGEYLKVKVLFQGKPLVYEKVYGTYAGFSNKGDYSITTLTNKEGVAEIKLNNSGYWLLKTEKTLAVKDKDLLKKCDKLFYSSSLTFQVN